MNSAEKSRQLAQRQRRVRQRVFGTDERPRLNVFRSSGHIYAQIINDRKGMTLAAASSLDKSLRTTVITSYSIHYTKLYDYQLVVSSRVGSAASGIGN